MVTYNDGLPVKDREPEEKAAAKSEPKKPTKAKKKNT